MKKLMRFLRKLNKLRTYKLGDKLLIIKAFFITGIMRSILILVPFKTLKKYIGNYNEESPFELNDNGRSTIEKIGWAVTKISKYTPWKSQCFVQALTAQMLLYKKGFKSTLYFGVSRSYNNGNLDAHAWIRCGNIFVTGGNGDKFSVVAKFTK